MAIEQWGFSSVPLLLWHEASVYNGHLRLPVTLTSLDERLAVELSLPDFSIFHGWDSNTQSSACEGEHSRLLHHRHGYCGRTNVEQIHSRENHDKKIPL